VLSPNCPADDEGDGLRFEFSRVARGRPVAFSFALVRRAAEQKMLCPISDPE
jgi:hypothetical protein